MATISDVKTLPGNVGQVIVEADRIGGFEKSDEKSGTDEENTKLESDGEGSVIDADAVEDRGKPSRMIPG